MRTPKQEAEKYIAKHNVHEGRTIYVFWCICGQRAMLTYNCAKRRFVNVSMEVLK